MAPVPRLAIYGLLSTSLFAAVTLSAINSRPNFYSAAVSVGRSSGAMMVLANFGLFNTILVGIGVKKLFFGQLRAIEYEHLFERLWIFLTESLLALTIFRSDFTTSFALLYGLLVFLKCFHWLTADRVEYMDQIPAPGPPTLFHLRAGGIITLLATLDLLLVLYSLDDILSNGVSAMVLFTSEFMILLASVWGTMARYAVSCIDLRRARGREDAPAWQEKSMYMFYIDLATDFVKLLTYLAFFTVILLNYGIPLHILRDVWMTLRSFISRCSDLIRYRRATRDMDAQYPNATEEDVGRMGDRVCIICREEMVVLGTGQRVEQAPEGGPNETPKKLGCGHVFHFHCLRSWLERQQSCPTCRRDVLNNPVQQQRRRPAPLAPAAAPGGRPQTPGERLMAEFEHYFRQPQENGAVPGPAPAAPAPAPGPAPAPAAGSPAPTSATWSAYTPIPTAPLQQTEEDVRIQQSIWGGPIQPGRFFPAPLGAIPRTATNTATATAGSSRPHAPAEVVANRLPPHLDLANALAGQMPSEPLRSAVPSFTNLPSEANTPFSSNPPEVFRSTSRSSDPDPDLRPEQGLDERHDRSLAAEAAMRRLGIQLTAPDPSDVPAPPTSDAIIKGKEKEQDPAHRHGFAFLSPPALPPPHPSANGLDERIRRLRAIDDKIGTLIEELTQLRNQSPQDIQPESRTTSIGQSEGGGGRLDGIGIVARDAHGSGQ